MPPAAAIAAVAALRRIAAAAAAGRPQAEEDSALLAQAIGAYLAGAASGVTLDRCFGVEVDQAGRSWWQIEALAMRDTALRRAGEQLAGGPRALEVAVRRYLAAGWQQDRRRGGVPAEHRGGIRELLFQACSATGGRVPGARQLARILG